jgi:hypothetical protein
MLPAAQLSTTRRTGRRRPLRRPDTPADHLHQDEHSEVHCGEDGIHVLTGKRGSDHRAVEVRRAALPQRMRRPSWFFAVSLSNQTSDWKLRRRYAHFADLCHPRAFFLSGSRLCMRTGNNLRPVDRSADYGASGRFFAGQRSRVIFALFSRWMRRISRHSPKGRSWNL